MPRFSVIVPMYNVEAYIGECIDSLQRQSFADFEAVCVDDGSTDDTLSVAKAAAAGDGRFVFVERPNGGLSAARNTGLAAATGEYVSFLDSDDRYATCALERMNALLSANDLDLLDFSASTFYDSAEARRAHEESYDYREDVPGMMQSGQELFVEYWIDLQFVSSACFHVVRRSVLDKAGLSFCEGLLHEDELFTPLLYAAAGRSAFLNEQLYERRMREGSIMTKPPTMRNVSSLVAIAQMLHAWLLENADCVSDAFAESFTVDIAFVRDAAARAAERISQSEVDEYRAGLSASERVDFDLIALHGATPSRMRERMLADSSDYRIGHALLAVPRALRHMKR